MYCSKESVSASLSLFLSQRKNTSELDESLLLRLVSTSCMVKLSHSYCYLLLVAAVVHFQMWVKIQPLGLSICTLSTYVLQFTCFSLDWTDHLQNSACICCNATFFRSWLFCFHSQGAVIPGPPFLFGAVAVLLAFMVALFIPEHSSHSTKNNAGGKHTISSNPQTNNPDRSSDEDIEPLLQDTSVWLFSEFSLDDTSGRKLSECTKLCWK